MSEKPQEGENARDEPRHDVTLLLVKWRSGDDEALDELVSLVYSELRRLAGRYLNHENRADASRLTTSSTKRSCA